MSSGGVYAIVECMRGLECKQELETVPLIPQNKPKDKTKEDLLDTLKMPVSFIRNAFCHIL